MDVKEATDKMSGFAKTRSQCVFLTCGDRVVAPFASSLYAALEAVFGEAWEHVSTCGNRNCVAHMVPLAPYAAAKPDVETPVVKLPDDPAPAETPLPADISTGIKTGIQTDVPLKGVDGGKSRISNKERVDLIELLCDVEQDACADWSGFEMVAVAGDRRNFRSHVFKRKYGLDVSARRIRMSCGNYRCGNPKHMAVKGVKEAEIRFSKSGPEPRDSDSGLKAAEPEPEVPELALAEAEPEPVVDSGPEKLYRVVVTGDSGFKVGQQITETEYRRQGRGFGAEVYHLGNVVDESDADPASTTSADTVAEPASAEAPEGKTKKRNMRQEAIAFFRKVDREKPDECVIWPFSVSNGQAVVAVEKGYKQATTFYYERKGTHQQGVKTRRTCGKKLCANPRHWKRY